MVVPSLNVLFSPDLWNIALQKFCEATRLTVKLYDTDAQVVFGPIHPTPFFQAFSDKGYEPGIFAECVRRCLVPSGEQAGIRQVEIVSQFYGLSVIGTSLSLEGRIVGAAVAGYAFIDFSQVSEVNRLARDSGIEFDQLWRLAREQKPVPKSRIIVNGELLQVIGDSLLRENFRTRQYEEAVQQLENAARAKDDFLAVVSHELRTPLTPILMWTHVLNQNSKPSEIPRAMEVIRRNANLQLRLIEDLLDMNRATKGKMNVVLAEEDVSMILRSAVESVRSDAAEKRITLDFAESDKCAMALADAGRLQQVFTNILVNAVKFTPHGGAIRVSLAEVGGGVVVKVRDTGQGIAPEFLPHAFEMFRQQEIGTRRSHSGLGIGLALVKSLVGLHGGNVQVNSEGSGFGTEVVVTLPALAPEVQTQAPDEPALTSRVPSALGGLSILVVEDSDDARNATEWLLRSLGAQVNSARNGREALKALFDAPPDLVLCDLAMPRMDGFEFLAELQHIRGTMHPQVIAVSGLTTEADHQRTREAGFASHVDKPFDAAALLSAIKKAQCAA